MPSLLRSRTRLAALGLVALLAVGCGGSSQMEIEPEDNPTFGPHDGPIGSLPGGGAFEVVAEQAGSQTRLLAYFFATEAMDTPLTPAPSAVSIDLAMPGGNSVTVPLSPADGDQTRFTSSPGDFEVDPLIGTLNATIEGAPVTSEFSGAHY